MSISDRPLISVITVVFNGERFLESTIKSVLAQDYGNLEYWLIDGGSRDGSVDIIRRHADHLRGWISEPDQGISDAFNKGLARAQGDYVMFLNADDELADAGAITRLVEQARAHGWPKVIYGDCDLYDATGENLLRRVAISYDPARFVRGQLIPHPSMLMHREYFEKYGRFDLSFKLAMDYDLFLRGIPDIGAVRAPTLISKIRFGGVSTRNRKQAVDEVMRALVKNGRLGRAGELRLRTQYAMRSVARRGLEVLGLYKLFDTLRSRGRRQTVSESGS